MELTDFYEESRQYHKNEVVGFSVDMLEGIYNNAAALSVLDIQIPDSKDGLQHVFDYSAVRYEQENMSEFKNLYKSVIAATFNNANTDVIILSS